MDLTTISKKMKELREEKKWTQGDLAEESGVPVTTVAKIEGGFIKNPTIEKLAKIAKALGVSVDKLIK
jgi:transcriptional regulator with XRE-family HTH domain